MFAFKSNEDIKFLEESMSSLEHNEKGTAELVVAMEELAELQQQVSKYIRGVGDKDHIIEELADALIMIDRIMCIVDVSNIDLNNAIIRKLNKHKSRVAQRKGQGVI